MTSIMHKAMTTTPPRPSELAVTAPAQLDPVVARAMARRPEDRFDTAADFAAALRMPLAPVVAVPEARADDATIVSRTGMVQPGGNMADATLAGATQAGTTQSGATRGEPGPAGGAAAKKGSRMPALAAGAWSWWWRRRALAGCCSARRRRRSRLRGSRP